MSHTTKPEITQLLDENEALKAQVQHWKSNHDNQVVKNALLMQRHDLPVDRIPAYRELERLQNAVLVEREMCAKLCEEIANSIRNEEIHLKNWEQTVVTAEDCASAIRSRND